ncbi:unnamed protein product [Scytosiphon promiscuus]
MSSVAAGVGDGERKRLGRVLIWQVEKGSMKGVGQMLHAGADVNGSGTDLPPPITAAANLGRVDVMKLLIEHGADLEAASFESGSAKIPNLRGLRAVHAAVRAGHVDALSILLRAGANPNSVNIDGDRPLMLVPAEGVPTATRLEMVNTLLSAGADLSLGSEKLIDRKAIHSAAGSGDTILVQKLISSVPTTLNAMTEDGASPLAIAAYHGHRDTVSFLLAAGANDIETLKAKSASTLCTAVEQGKEDVVRILLDEGSEAIGGDAVIFNAVFFCVRRDNANILDMLLNVHGGMMREVMAKAMTHMFDKSNAPGDALPPMPILHVAASHCSYRAAHVLLAAGADELTVNAGGEYASDVIGSSAEEGGSWKKVALSRMLKRGPAFRARSWTWPTHAEDPVGKAARAVHLVQGSARRPVLRMRVLQRKNRGLLLRSLARFAVASDPPPLSETRSKATSFILRTAEGYGGYRAQLWTSVEDTTAIGAARSG